MERHKKNKKEIAQSGIENLVNVNAVVNFIPDQSDAKNHKFTWVYEIAVKNNSEEIIQLLNRFWRIVDMTGKIEEVRGAGVIGLQPIIKPGKEFIYTSYCQLTTPQGTMEGRYEMQNLDEAHFDVWIPKFILSGPSEMTKLFRSRLH